MKLRDLTKPQWDAAREAATILMRCNPQDADDRARFREARDKLAALLPEGADERDLIKQAAHWNSLNDFTAAFLGLPPGVLEIHRG